VLFKWSMKKSQIPGDGLRPRRFLTAVIREGPRESSAPPLELLVLGSRRPGGLRGGERKSSWLVFVDGREARNFHRVA